MLPRLPHRVRIITPATVRDDRGNDVLVYTSPPAEYVEVDGWIQQDSSRQDATDGRTPQIREWTLITYLPGVELSGLERVELLSATEAPQMFSMFGPPEPTYTLREYHHHEIKLVRTDG